MLLTPSLNKTDSIPDIKQLVLPDLPWTPTAEGKISKSINRLQDQISNNRLTGILKQ